MGKGSAAVKALRAEISRQLEPDHNDAIGGNAMLPPLSNAKASSWKGVFTCSVNASEEIVAAFQVWGRAETM